MDYAAIARTALFDGCTEADIRSMEGTLALRLKRAAQGEYLLCAGSPVERFGLVLKGAVRIENNDAWGHTAVLGIAQEGEVFAEAYACLPGQPLLVNAVAASDCEILTLDYSRLLRDASLPGHAAVIRNLVRISARKNLQLSQRIFDTAPKTIRERVLSYLSRQAAVQGSRTVVIPFDRQQLADYLNVDRSALSKELGRMRADGLISCRKNRFVLRQTEESGPREGQPARKKAQARDADKNGAALPREKVVSKGMTEFTLNRQCGWYEGKAGACRIILCADKGAETSCRTALRSFERCEAALPEWGESLKKYAAQTLLEDANEWREDDGEPPLTEEEFAGMLSLWGFTFYSNGTADASYDDGGIFEGHCILVSIGADGTVTGAEIAG